MMGKIAVYLGEQRVMLTGQQLDEFFDHGTGRAIAGVPADAPGGAVEPLDQPRGIAVHHGDRLDAPLPRDPVTLPGDGGKRHDIRSKKGLMVKHQLEAIVIGGIMAAGYLDAAVHIQDRFGMIEHRRGTETDAQHVDAAGRKAPDQRRFQGRGTEPPIMADRDP